MKLPDDVNDAINDVFAESGEMSEQVTEALDKLASMPDDMLLLGHMLWCHEVSRRMLTGEFEQ